MNGPAISIEHVTNSQSGVPPEPPEAHQRAAADWVQIEQQDLDRHLLSGEFFISWRALMVLAGRGTTVHDVLGWFNAYEGSIAVGETRQIASEVRAFFGFDGSKPNGQAFFVEIDLLAPPACAVSEPAAVASVQPIGAAA